ncbi:MAG: hypothetical protein CSB55_01195 [Candidatus Cloacimonadota bacterium]|nr:MAG: hypothetical protein CSB55_01195 [Candidatus Cloacimonadota bacterium]
MDYNGLIEAHRGNPLCPASKYDFLYDENYLNNFEIYTSFEGLKFSLKYFINILKNKKSNADADRPLASFNRKESYLRFGGIENWIKQRDNKDIKQAFETIRENLKKKNSARQSINAEIKVPEKYLQETIIKYAEKYPETEFILIIPTY